MEKETKLDKELRLEARRDKFIEKMHVKSYLIYFNRVLSEVVNSFGRSRISQLESEIRMAESILGQQKEETEEELGKYRSFMNAKFSVFYNFALDVVLS